MRILDAIAESRQIEELADSLKGKKRASALFGAHRIHRAVCAAAFSLRTDKKVIAGLESDADAFRSAEDIRTLGFAKAEALPSREITLLDVEGASREEEIARLSVLGKAAKGELDLIQGLDIVLLLAVEVVLPDRLQGINVLPFFFLRSCRSGPAPGFQEP